MSNLSLLSIKSFVITHFLDVLNDIIRRRIPDIGHASSYAAGLSSGEGLMPQPNNLTTFLSKFTRYSDFFINFAYWLDFVTISLLPQQTHDHPRTQPLGPLRETRTDNDRTF